MNATDDLVHIDKLEPLAPEDEDCLAELRGVLERHGRLKRFGVTLLHRHFDTADDEILVEACDVEKRTLVIQPVAKSALGASRSIQTNWRLDSGEATVECMQICQVDSDTNRHCGTTHL